jgi:thiol-disulfide isomerase/thioredoxin
VLVTLLASSWTAADAATLELTPTSQFAVQGSTIYRSVELPPTFLVEPSPFGRSVLIRSGGPSARLLDPKRITRDAADPDVVRIDMSGPQEDFLSVRLVGSDLVLERDGRTMTLKASPPLLGDLSLDELIAAMPEYRRDATRYTPDPAALEKLRHLRQPTELLVFFGSWCPHCAQAVPRLVRVLQDVQGAPMTVTFHGVPHDGKDPLATDLRVTGLPTAIVRRDNKELTRMGADDWNAPERGLAALLTSTAR